MAINLAKWGFVALGALIGASVALTAARAETPSLVTAEKTPTVSNGSATTNLRTQAEFVSAATYTVEHQPMTIKKSDPASVETNIVTREAYVTIGGLPGETVSVTCDVSSMHEQLRNVRDCGGQPRVEQRLIMSGQKLDDGVLLTNDLMPNETGKSDSTVSFEVSYP
jgi:hypothetical protein